jgi:hypothetical protein
MPGYYDRRERAVNMLEQAQVKLIKFAQTYRSQREEKIQVLTEKGKPVPDTLTSPINANMLTAFKSANESSSSSSDADQAESGQGPATRLRPEDLGKADQLVPRDKRPTHRIKPKWAPFGLGWMGVGQKVDTIDWARNEIADVSVRLQEGRDQLHRDVQSVGTGDDVYPPLNSAFIHFNQQIAAHMATQILVHHKPYVRFPVCLQPRHI